MDKSQGKLPRIPRTPHVIQAPGRHLFVEGSVASIHPGQGRRPRFPSLGDQRFKTHGRLQIRRQHQLLTPVVIEAPRRRHQLQGLGRTEIIPGNLMARRPALHRHIQRPAMNGPFQVQIQVRTAVLGQASDLGKRRNQFLSPDDASFSEAINIWFVTATEAGPGLLENLREFQPCLRTGDPVRIHRTLTKHPGLLHALRQVIPGFIDQAAPRQQIESVPGEPAIVTMKSKIVPQGGL